MKYKIGDKVRIKSLDWYNENKDGAGYIRYERVGAAYPVFFSKYMSNFCGEILTIKSVYNHSYHMSETSSCEYWTDEMIECKVEDNFESTANSITQSESDAIEKAKTYWDSIKDAWICPNGYIFKDENGNVIEAKKIVLEKKKKEYPKTYEECCTILGFHYDHYLTYDDEKDINPTKEEEEFIDLIDVFSRLIVCRNAYWKLYGEEMGLGKPWEPDWTKADERKYCIVNTEGNITKWVQKTTNKILAFPTSEMRDAYYENFKELIEECKELL